MLGDEKIRELLQATSERKSPLTWIEVSLFSLADFLAEFYFVDFFTFVSRIFFVKVKSFTYVQEGIILWS
jgi:hypothetical protein